MTKPLYQSSLLDKNKEIKMAEIWVKADANLPEKEEDTPFVVTKEIKDEVMKLDEITINDVCNIVAPTGKGSIEEAKQVIEELVNEKKIISKEARYDELYPSAVELGP